MSNVKPLIAPVSGVWEIQRESQNDNDYTKACPSDEAHSKRHRLKPWFIWTLNPVL
jgi:hypothetical protein